MRDLFGVEVSNYQGVDEADDYEAYIRSGKWKKIRLRKLEEVGWRCERCGLSKFSVRLEVHHKHYERFGSEAMEDLEVLCSGCHEKADMERREVVRRARFVKSPLMHGFEGWMDARSNRKENFVEHWRRLPDERLEREWRYFLKTIGIEYEVAFRRHVMWWE